MWLVNLNHNNYLFTSNIEGSTTNATCFGHDLKGLMTYKSHQGILLLSYSPSGEELGDGAVEELGDGAVVPLVRS